MNSNPFEMASNPFEQAQAPAPMQAPIQQYQEDQSNVGFENPFTNAGSNEVEQMNPFTAAAVPAAAPAQHGGFQPGGFPPARQQGFNNPGFGGANQKRRYRFVQMYMLINPKLFAKQQFSAGEVPILEISYNVDYGNVRLGFANTRADTFDQTCIKVQNLERLTTVNIYQETAEQLLYNIEHWKGSSIQVIERMIQSSASWSPNLTIFQVNPTDKSVTLTTKTNNGQFVYVFNEWQLNSLINSMKFLINGPAWNLENVRFLAPEQQ